MAKRQKDRQHNDQKTEGQTIQWQKDRRTDNTMAKRKQKTNNDLQNTTQKTKDSVIRTSIKSRGEFRLSGRCVSLFTNPVISHE